MPYIDADDNGLRDIKTTDWVFVHDGQTAFLFGRCPGQTTTHHNLFVGTEAECRAEIDRLGLMAPEE